MKEIPVLNANKVPEGLPYYVMECTLTVENIETVGDISNEKRAELNGYLSAEVLQASLDLMREVIA